MVPSVLVQTGPDATFMPADTILWKRAWRKTGAGTELVSLYILDIGINTFVYIYI